tara:strand:- start:50 stop:316 length:267 start_codon:yes stop_codon:yes gene_type:complete
MPNNTYSAITREDLESVRDDLREDIKDIKQDLKDDIKDVKSWYKETGPRISILEQEQAAQKATIKTLKWVSSLIAPFAAGITWFVTKN